MASVAATGLLLVPVEVEAVTPTPGTCFVALGADEDAVVREDTSR